MSETHADADWYHGNLAREACESIMSPFEPGKFLVRKSNMTQGCYVLSVCGPRQPNGTVSVENYLIRVVYSGAHPQFTIDDKDLFNDLEQLVAFYRSEAHAIACPLSKPVSRRPPLNNNSSAHLNGRAAPPAAPNQSAFLSSRPLFTAQSSTFQSQMSVNSNDSNVAFRPYNTAPPREFSERSSPFSTLSHTSLNSVASNHSESWVPNNNGSPRSGGNRTVVLNHSRSNSVASNNPVVAQQNSAVSRSSETPSSSGSSSHRQSVSWQRSGETSSSVHSFSPAATAASATDSMLKALQSVLEKLERDGWLIDPAELHLASAQSLGGGEFGEVLRGELGKLPSLRRFAVANRRTDRGTIVVAVKKLKTVEKLAEFYSEALLMTDLHHANLVRLIGVVRAPAPSPSPVHGEQSAAYSRPADIAQSALSRMNIWIVTEYCSQGDLVKYLRSQGNAVISSAEQLRFSLEVCAAMRFLEAQRIVHRDLAARNVLLDDEAHCKLSDFGLARRLRRDGTIVPAGDGFLTVDEETYKFPVKWTAPEAIRTAVYTSKSDVWSYGVLLWEIYSFGAMPYKRMQLNDVLGYIERGYRMECPVGCPSEMYALMQTCWQDSPDKRPTFKQLYDSLSELDIKHKTAAVPAT